MKERPISVTEASRNFAECINRVRYQGLSFLLVKNGEPVARLVPATGAAHTVIEGNTTPEAPAALLVGNARGELPENQPPQLTAKAKPAVDSPSVPGPRDRSLQW